MSKRDETRQAIEAALRADPLQADRVIARKVGSSHPTVAKVRRALAGAGDAGKVSRRKRRPNARAMVTPYEYALALMNNPRAEPKRRDSMARALLTFQKGGGHATAAEPLPAPPPPKPAEGEERSWAVILGDKK